tara:strand:- start:126 stop:683 length:558 start_codon:yes stop_codon:yes gene_type:complete
MRPLLIFFVLIMFGFPALAQDQRTNLNLDFQNINPMNQTLDSMRADRSSGKYSERILGLLNDPTFFVQTSFYITKDLPKRAPSVKSTKNGFVTRHVATCNQTVNREEDFEGKCKDYYFKWDQSVTGNGLAKVELEIHPTCLDDSCHHEYHQFELVQEGDIIWRYKSHKKGLRCDPLRGGGPPPCL